MPSHHGVDQFGVQRWIGRRGGLDRAGHNVTAAIYGQRRQHAVIQTAVGLQCLLVGVEHRGGITAENLGSGIHVARRVRRRQTGDLNRGIGRERRDRSADRWR